MKQITARFAAGVAAVLSLTAAALAQPTITVQPAASVQGREIRLRDISDATGPAGDIVLGAAALPGRNRTLTAGDIRLRLRAARLDPNMVNAPAVITVSTVGAEVAGDAVVAAAVDAVKKVLPWAGDDTTVAPVSTPVVPALRGGGTPVITAGAPVLRSSRTATVPVTLATPEGVTPAETRTVEVSLRISVMVPAVVAARPIARRQIIGPDDVTVARVEMEGGKAIGNVADVIGKRAANSVATGRRLSPSDFEEAPVVAANTPVTVRVVAGAVEVNTTGTTREEGRIGQMVRVRIDIDPKRPGTGREIRARVADAETVVLENP